MNFMKIRKVFIVFILLCISNFSFAGNSQEFYKKLLDFAPHTVGLKEFPLVNNIKYRGDCSGFIVFLFHAAGLNLMKLFGIGSGGVEALWNGLAEYGLLSGNDLQPGDIIFFDNTYDKNKNNIWDDELSHIGVVESIDEYKTATYLHYASDGVRRAKINLLYPEVFIKSIDGSSYRFNDILRRSDAGNDSLNPRYLSGSLYRGAVRLSLKNKKASNN